MKNSQLSEYSRQKIEMLSSEDALLFYSKFQSKCKEYAGKHIFFVFSRWRTGSTFCFENLRVSGIASPGHIIKIAYPDPRIIKLSFDTSSEIFPKKNNDAITGLACLEAARNYAEKVEIFTVIREPISIIRSFFNIYLRSLDINSSTGSPLFCSAKRELFTPEHFKSEYIQKMVKVMSINYLEYFKIFNSSFKFISNLEGQSITASIPNSNVNATLINFNHISDFWRSFHVSDTDLKLSNARSQRKSSTKIITKFNDIVSQPFEDNVLHTLFPSKELDVFHSMSFQEELIRAETNKGNLAYRQL